MDTTQILIPGDDAYMLASKFSDFAVELNTFASICSAKEKNTTSEYQEAFESLEASFYSLRDVGHFSQQGLDQVNDPVNELFERIESFFALEEEYPGVFTKLLDEIYRLVSDFLSNEILSDSPRNFKHRFFESVLSNSARSFYSEELFDAISNQLEHSGYDDAVLAAFKYLDKRLRKLVGIDSYELFGEELINRVFSPNSGVLQLNTHPNEQTGLRNWFSGANAVFRNPIAHRFSNLDEKSALSVIAMVSLMINIATKLADKKEKSA